MYVNRGVFFETWRCQKRTLTISLFLNMIYKHETKVPSDPLRDIR